MNTQKHNIFLFKIAVFSAILLFLLLPSKAQENLKFRTITVNDGLPHSKINVITQDKSGFIWIGTENGLAKYDGYTFTIYKNELNDNSSISDDCILSILEEENDALWIGTKYGGVNKFDILKNKFWNAQNDTTLAKLKNQSVKSIHIDSEKHLWVGGSKGLEMLSTDGQIRHFLETDPAGKKLSGNNIVALNEGEKNEVWIASDKGVDIYDLNTGRIRNYEQEDSLRHGLSSSQINCLFKDAKGQLWIGSDDKLQKYNRRLDSFDNIHEFYDAKAKRIVKTSTITENESQNLWVGTKGAGLFEINVQSSLFEQHKNNPRLRTSLTDNSINCIYNDKSNIIWIGTANNGICIYNSFENKFDHVQYIPNLEHGLSDKNISSFFIDSDNRLWVGTKQGDKGGLNLTDQTSQSTTKFYHSHEDSLSLSNNNINFIYEDKLKRIWVGTENGLDIFNRTDSTFEHHKVNKHSSDGLSNSNVTYMTEDAKGNLLIGTKEGLNIIELSSYEVHKHYHKKNAPNSLKNNYVTSILVDKEGKIWVGTYGGGLNECVPIEQEYKKCIFNSYTNSSSPTSLSNNTILSLLEDSKGQIWVGTKNGLNKFNKKNGIFERINSKDGLPNNVINGIVEGRPGILWLSTNNGLVKYLSESKRFEHYTVSDGLQSNLFNARACYKSEENELFFGGENGYNKFKSDNINLNDYKPQVVLTNLKLSNSTITPNITHEGEIVLHRPIDVTKSIELKYNVKSVTIEFAALNYGKTKKQKYAYLLENFDDEWHFVDENQRYAAYSNLKPNIYIFKVKATNNDGIWNDASTELLIIIKPPIWDTLWFKIMIALGVITFVYVYFRSTINKYEKEKKQLEDVVSENQIEISKKKEVIVKKEEQINKNLENLKMLSRLGVDIALKLTPERIILNTYNSVNALMDARVFAIGRYDEKSQTLRFNGTIEDGQNLNEHSFNLDEKDRLAVFCFKNQEDILISDFNAEFKKYLPNRAIPVFGKKAVSIIYIPLNLKSKRLGVITVQSFTKNAYNEFHQMILKNIAIFTAIAFENSFANKKMDTLKSRIENIDAIENKYKDELKQIGERYSDLQEEQEQTESKLKSALETIHGNIEYTKKIRNGILPTTSQIKDEFEHFIIDRPKETLGGDFYWIHTNETGSVKKTFFVVADCTGQGLNGTLISFLGVRLLNQIIKEENEHQPEKILDRLDELFIAELRKRSQTRDITEGMDIAVTCIEKTAEVSFVTYAGAKRPLYFAIKGPDNIESLKPARRSIGRRRIKTPVEFTSQQIELQTGDLLYLCSDGLVKQPNLEGQKFGSNNFIDALNANKDKPLQYQERTFTKLIDELLENNRQMDDILLCCLKL